jgi:plasmid stabilization system protein ParE
MAEVIWSARSLIDIDEIANYIAKDSYKYAEEQVRQFFLKVKVLEKYPSMGRMVPELQTETIRQILCGHYRIIYEILSKGKIAIITVHHQSRLLANNPAVKRVLRRKRKNK